MENLTNKNTDDERVVKWIERPIGNPDEIIQYALAREAEIQFITEW